MESTLLALPIDVVGEGPDRVVGNAIDRAGVGGVSLAVAYHDSRDVLPHNPMRRISHGGAGLCFPPEVSRYARTGLRPQVSDVVGGRDVLEELCAAATRRGVAVDAWAVYLHDDAGVSETGLGQVRNVYGDPYPHSLCPSAAAVRDYAAALTEDVLRYPVATVLAEALHWMPFNHGYHHERAFIALPPAAQLLLGTCFCPPCRRVAEANGIDPTEVEVAVRAYLDPLLAGAQAPTEPVVGVIQRLANGALARYLHVRTDQVTSLLRDIADIVAAAGRRLIFLDLSAGIQGWETGEPTGPPSAEEAWQLGIDLPAIAALCGTAVTAYAREPRRVAVELAHYAAAQSRRNLTAVLRPMAPDCNTSVNLREKLQVARDAGVVRTSFYSYGFMPLRNLDWIAHALHG